MEFSYTKEKNNLLVKFGSHKNTQYKQLIKKIKEGAALNAAPSQYF